MAIKKKLIHFKNYSDFNSKKLSANEANTQYTQGVGGAIQNGSPDILYQSICWIKDTKQQWTHGQLYDLSGGGEMPDLADVAFSGDYEDLSNKPTIPAEQVNADWNATSGKAQILNKPTIPKGTITGVSANGTSVATSGVANIPAATTGKYGVTKLSSATNSTSTTLAATPSAVKSAYDLANGKYTKPSTGIPFGDFEEQVQGSIIKAEESVQGVSMYVTTGNATAGNFFNVNKDANGNVSIQMIQNTLASGKIAIPYTTDVKQYVDQAVANAGGGGSPSGGSKETVEIEPELILGGDYRAKFSNILPDKLYICRSAVKSVDIYLSSESSNPADIFTVIFMTSSSTSLFIMGKAVVWANGVIPTFRDYETFELTLRRVYLNSVEHILVTGASFATSISGIDPA